MLRTACAWTLVLLAASPLTAPFSTCTIQSLFSRSARAQIVVIDAPTVATAPAANSDANSLPPVESRIEAPRDSASHAAIDDVVSHGDRYTVGRPRQPQPIAPSDHSATVRLTVLRL